MNQSHKAEVVVLGSGPAGLVFALEASKSFRTTLIVGQLPANRNAVRVDSVPASLLALFVELGVHPRQIGISELHKTRRVAWKKEAPDESSMQAAAYIERPLLEKALLTVAVASNRLKIIPFTSRTLEQVFRDVARNKIELVDASGRSSLSSRAIVRPTRTWAARTFLALRQACGADPEMRIAALPDGFVYRLGSSSHIAVGVVGRNAAVAGAPSAIERHLRQCGAGWVLESIGPLAELIHGSVSTASVQWSVDDLGLRIGDAALARDPLSGQGLATAISDALCAASAFGNEDHIRLLRLRQNEQRVAHLRALARSIGDCLFRHEQTWREYSEFLAQHLDSKQMGTRIALNRGKLTLLANEQSLTLETNHRNDHRSELTARASNRDVSVEIPR